MFDSKLIDVGPDPIALEPPGDATDYRPGYSVIIRNPLEVALKVGGEERQVFTVAAGSTFPVNDIEADERLWVKTAGDEAEGQIETLWQGVVVVPAED